VAYLAQPHWDMLSLTGATLSATHVTSQKLDIMMGTQCKYDITSGRRADEE